MAKDKGGNNPNISEIDSNISDVVGKRVYYQLLDSEGGTDEPGGRKRPAITNRVYQGKRDEQGRILTGIFVMEGSGFSKDAPTSSGREPGTFDLYKSGDAVS